MSAGIWFVLLFVWIISAVVAGLIANYYRERSFGAVFWVTFFFLGPQGPGFALIAPHGGIENAQLQGPRKTPEGRRRFVCPRCNAENNIPEDDTSYDCWRCSEHRTIKPKAKKA